MRLSLLALLALPLVACTVEGEVKGVDTDTGPVESDEDADGYLPSEGDCDDADANNWKSTVNGYVTCAREKDNGIGGRLNKRQYLAPTSGE